MPLRFLQTFFGSAARAWPSFSHGRGMPCFRLLPARGFTLIEMLIVMSLIAMLATASAVSLRPLFARSQVKSEVGRLLEAINLARSEAILSSQPVSICPSAMAQHGEARCGGDFSHGWIVFTNQDRDSVVDPPGDRVLQVYSGLPRGLYLSNRRGTQPVSESIHYLSDGTSHRNRTLLLCSEKTEAAFNSSIVINIVGRPRLAEDWGNCAGDAA